MRNLKRREFLKLCGTGFVSFSAMPPALQALEHKKVENAAKKPNIIFVHTDSWDGRALGFLGLAAMKRATPNIDRLAQRGTTFENTYCSHPICCPSRANTFSGMYTFKCKSWNNHKGLEAGASTLFDNFKEAGYNNGVFGKTDYVSGAHTQLARITAWTGTADIQLPVFRVEAPLITNNRTKGDVDWKTTESGLNFLKETADSGKPFFLYVGLKLPHPTFMTSQKWLDLVDIDEVTVPPKDKQDHPVMEYQRISNNWTHGFDDKMVKKVRAIYYAMCSETDAMVGRLMDKMDQLGLTDNTYFVFSSDHGENNMEHRQWYKMNMYESSVRVPLIVAGPNIKQGQIIDNIVSLIDLYPTFTEMADLRRTQGIDGESLMPLMTGKTMNSRNFAFAMFTGCSANTSMFMLRKENWKYITYPGFEPQLFNLKKDPDEIDNVATLFPDVVKRMDKELMEICDYKKVHAERVAYDKKSFSEYRSHRMKEPLRLREYGADIPKAYYMDIMTNTYIGYTSEHENKIKKWLGDSP